MSNQTRSDTIIVVSGPESCGKTHLVEDLSGIFDAIVVPEYARSYVENLDRPYTFEDVEEIARWQQKSYLEIEKGQGKVILFDTFLVISKVWFDYVYKRCPEWIIDGIKEMKVDLVLLCKPDLPWVSDGVRENGHIRNELFDRYKEEFESFGIKYKIVEGQGQSRTELAKQYINQLLSLKPNYDKQSNSFNS
jgi:NadR type nicotinamide-nucleotide adenylyltransferase